MRRPLSARPTAPETVSLTLAASDPGAGGPPPFRDRSISAEHANDMSELTTPGCQTTSLSAAGKAGKELDKKHEQEMANRPKQRKQTFRKVTNSHLDQEVFQARYVDR